MDDEENSVEGMFDDLLPFIKEKADGKARKALLITFCYGIKVAFSMCGRDPDEIISSVTDRSVEEEVDAIMDAGNDKPVFIFQQSTEVH